MEAKLAEYRQRKANEWHTDNEPSLSRYFSSVRTWFKRRRKVTEQNGDDATNRVAEVDSEHLQHDFAYDDHPGTERQLSSANYGKFYVIEIVLKSVMWALLWGLFIQWGFGAVYFAVSSLLIIYFSMKSGTRDKNKLSAYSVFNPNFERLDGTFTAEQFEKELRFGAGSVR